MVELLPDRKGGFIRMENLLFCLNATVPIFLTMMLGCLFKKIGWIDELFTKRLNKFVFQVALPALLFEDLATVDLAEVWDMGYVAYCFAAPVTLDCSVIAQTTMSGSSGSEKPTNQELQFPSLSNSAVPVFPATE